MHDLLIRIEAILSKETHSRVKSHDLGQTSNFYIFFEIVTSNYLATWIFHDNEALSFDTVQVFLVDIEELLSGK